MTDQPRIALILARAKNGVIGADGGLPWRLPADMRHFKDITLNKPVIMGRKTWESLPKPLVDRLNIVITRNTAYAAAGAQVAPNVEAAIEVAKKEMPGREVMVIGGAEIYQLALPRARRIYLTEIDLEPEGDTYFDVPDAGWQETAREDHAAEGDKPAYSFVTLERA